MANPGVSAGKWQESTLQSGVSAVIPHGTPGAAAGNSGWRAEGEPRVAPIRNEVDSILAQVVILSLRHWEAALMLRLVWEGSGEAG